MKSGARDPIGQRSRLRAFDHAPLLGAEKTVISSFNHVAAVQAAFVLQAMQEVAHDRGVIRPAFRGRGEIVVAVQKTDPYTARIAPRETNEFSAQPRNDQP